MNISQEEKNKIIEKLKIYGIFLGIIVFLFLISVLMIFASRSSWQKGLKNEVQTVLREKSLTQYTVSDFIKIDSSISYSAAVFHLKSSTGSDKNYAVIVRINSLYGPLPAVFLYNKNRGTEFVGLASVHGRIQKIFEESQSSIRLEYWNKKVPQIIQKAGIDE